MIRKLFSSKGFALCNLLLVIGFFVGYYYSLTNFDSNDKTVVKVESKVTENKKPIEVIKNDENKIKNDEEDHED